MQGGDLAKEVLKDWEPLQTEESSSVFWGAGYMICTHTLVRTIQFRHSRQIPRTFQPPLCRDGPGHY